MSCTLPSRRFSLVRRRATTAFASVVHEHAPVVTPRDQPTSIDDAQRRYATSRRAFASPPTAPKSRGVVVDASNARTVPSATPQNTVTSSPSSSTHRRSISPVNNRSVSRAAAAVHVPSSPRVHFGAKLHAQLHAVRAVSRRRHVPHVPRVRPERVALRAHLNRLSAVARVHDAPSRGASRSSRPARAPSRSRSPRPRSPSTKTVLASPRSRPALAARTRARRSHSRAPRAASPSRR